MRILLLGEASFVHTILRKGFRELGHDVILMSGESKHLDCQRDVNLQRDMKWGKLGGLKIIWKLILNFPRLFGNDIVQIHDYRFIPLRAWINELFFVLLKLGNKKVVKCCLCDDAVIFNGQAKGLLHYSDTHIGKKTINEKQNELRIKEHMIPELLHCCNYSNAKADVLLPCLYEYYVYYDLLEYHDKLYYMPLPIDIKSEVPQCVYKVDLPVKVLVGIQKERDYIKGASVISALVEKIAAENPGKIEVKKVYDVPYNKYLTMLDEADVLVDQLYSYTPSMNSLAAMAHGTVVIGGGEEEFYEFIGEKTLRPIINVRPEDDENNLDVLRKVLLDPAKIESLKREGFKFVRKHHDYLKICGKHIELYKRLLGISDD